MEILNSIELQIKAFFFNAQTDYLPYYKNFTFNVTSNETLLDILEMIKSENHDFSYPNGDVVLRVNGLVVNAKEKISTITNKLGKEIRIDPVLTYRSNNGLIINDDDFMQSFELLAPYTDEEDKAYYDSLYPLHYASASFEYNHNYIGDAILVLASRLIEKNPEKDDEILKAINDEFNGLISCEYENNLFHAQDHTETIGKLKKEILKKVPTPIIDKLCNLAMKPKKHLFDTTTIHEQNIALYTGETSELIESTRAKIIEKGARFIDFPMATKLAGQSLIDTNPELAHIKAGTMLLDALDHGADILLFTKESDLKLFKSMLAKCERVMGRDIVLTLVSTDELQSIASRVAV